MSFFFIIWNNLWRRRTRSLLTVAGVAVGVAAGVAMAAIAWGFQDSLERVYTARGADLIVTRMTNRKPLPTPFEQTCAKDVAAMPGVHAVAAVAWDMLSIDEAPALAAYGWEPGSFLWEHLTLQAGEFKDIKDSGDWIYLGEMCAEMLKKKVGDTVQIESRTLRVAGIFQSSATVENAAPILPLTVLQSILGTEGKVNFLNVRLTPNETPNQVEKLRQTIQSRYRGLKIFRVGEVAQNNIGIQTAKAMSLATSAIALLISTLGMMNTLLMSVFERTSEIGLLMAVGWRRSRVVAMILLESLMLSMTGAVAGISVAIIGVRCMQKMEFMQGKIEGEFSLGLIGVALGITAVLGILGGLYPAARAASMQPHTALRSE
jgi:putative ABC transport system permease protein